MEPEYESVFKIILAGDSGVGKSSLLLRFVSSSFSERYDSTIGVDFKVRIIELDGKKIKLQIWDTSGDERFREITTAFYQAVHGVILVYDATKPESFEEMKLKIEEVERLAGEGVCKVLVGNKYDLAEQLVDCKSVNDLAASLGIPCLQTSAKDSINVERPFVALAAEIIKGKESEH